jgi:hypothetical protein
MNKTERQMLQEHINMMVENIVDEEFLSEKKKKDNKPHHSTKWEKKAGKQDKRKPKNDSNKKSETNQDKKERQKKSKNSKNAARRARVIKWLKDPSVNCAEIMRKLWKPSKKKEDAARSFFYKCRDGALNDSGVAYSFSEGDINRLYAIKNNLI